MAKPKFIQLNLQTKDYDFREYLDRKSVEASIEAGETVSITRYIQNLILDDMGKDDDARSANKDTLRAEIKDAVDKMGLKELELLSYLIKGLQK